MTQAILRRHAKTRTCVGKGCKNPCYGQEQLCDDCHKKRLICQYPGCNKPHGGNPHTTKYCPQCRSKVRRKPRSTFNPEWTPAEDKLIRDIYGKHHGKEAGRLLREAFPLRPRWSINRRAQVLGAATIRKKEPRWTPEEDAILREHSWMSPERIQIKLREKGYKRSVTGVSIRMNRTRVRQHIDGLTAQGLAKLLNIDVHAVLRWIKDGLLKAERFGTSGDNHDHHYITTEAVRAFFVANVEKIELSKLERVGSKMWFLEVLTGGQISEHGDPAPVAAAPAAAGGDARTFPLYGERVTLAALSDITGRTMAELLRRIDEQGMSVEAAAFGPDAPEEAAVDHPLALEVGAQLRALMRTRRAGPASMVRWTGLPAPLVARLQKGSVPVLLPALLTCVEKLAGEVEITIRPKSAVG